MHILRRLQPIAAESMSSRSAGLLLVLRLQAGRLWTEVSIRGKQQNCAKKGN
jgi:hypothetical protein